MTRKTYHRKRRTQILCGLGLLAITAIILIVASKTETKDATAALLFGPLGLYAIFTKKLIIY
jgi:hypothetical protein